MQTTVKGLIIKEQTIGESDRLVTLLSDEFGLVRAFVRRAQNYKNSNLSIAEIADRSFMSEVYFRKLFKEEYGVSPQKYIIDLRIQNAVGLIATGYYSLKEIAYMSGYNNYKYFSSEFKKVKGVSPSEYIYNYY